MDLISPKIRASLHPMMLSDEQLREVMTRLRTAIENGLSVEKHDSSDVKCYPTYVQDFPTGKEQGKYLALDLGGTNFRVLLITLDTPHSYDVKSKVYELPEETITTTGKRLFDHIADCLENFIIENGLTIERLPLGFTFSFPVTQQSLMSGILVQWTKGFNASGVVGEDVVRLLKQSLTRKRINVDPCVILNDTTGTLMSCMWKYPDTRVGLIVGTGCNACYVEQTKNALRYNGDMTKDHLIINCEWGNFGAYGGLSDFLTEEDREVDQNTFNKSQQIFEKMISGMYLGEIVRLLMLKFTKKKLLFGCRGSPKLCEKYTFKTQYLSEIEAEPAGTFTECKRILEMMGLGHASEEDCANVRFICEVVSKRSAYLVSAGVAVLVNKMEFPEITVGVDGSLFRFHPKYKDLMNEKIPQFLEPGKVMKLKLSEDGSGRGAALIAAVACKKDKTQGVK